MTRAPCSNGGTANRCQRVFRACCSVEGKVLLSDVYRNLIWRQNKREETLSMSVKMPVLDQRTLARRDDIVRALRAIVPGEGVIAYEREMRPYESDGLTAYRQLPMVVVLPDTTQQVSRVLAYCHANEIKVVPRGAGTSLSGGALPL